MNELIEKHFEDVQECGKVSFTVVPPSSGTQSKMQFYWSFCCFQGTSMDTQQVLFKCSRKNFKAVHKDSLLTTNQTGIVSWLFSI